MFCGTARDEGRGCDVWCECVTAEGWGKGKVCRRDSPQLLEVPGPGVRGQACFGALDR